MSVGALPARAQRSRARHRRPPDAPDLITASLGEPNQAVRGVERDPARDAARAGDRDLEADRARRAHPGDLAATSLREEQEAHGRRDTRGRAPGARDGELADNSRRRDRADLIGIALREPQPPIGTRDDVERVTAGPRHIDSETDPAVVIRPILSAAGSVNQSAPSGPAAIPTGSAPAESWNSVTAPFAAIRPIRSRAVSVNHIAPSGPAVIPRGSAGPAPAEGAATPNTASVSRTATSPRWATRPR